MSEKELIPPQETGAQSNTEAVAEMGTAEEAKQFFAEVKNRLLYVNNWHQVAGAFSADFMLTDALGNEVNRTAEKGDHFKIDIPGPGPATGDGYDWVQIETIEETKEGDSEVIAMRVRPATNPNNEQQDIAHFFSDEATSCFMVKRENTKVIAGVYGRNEKPNTGAEKTIDKVRNSTVATGAVTAFSKLQWKSLVNGLVKK